MLDRQYRKLHWIPGLVAGFSVAIAALAPTALASGWTAARAAATIKAHYSTIDQATYDFAAAHGWKDAMKTALHAAKPTTVACKATRSKAKFYCTAVVQGSFRPPPDYELYTATKHLTFAVNGKRWKIRDGWR